MIILSLLDDVPPLEDMSEYVRKLKTVHDKPKVGKDSTSRTMPSSKHITVDRSLLQLEDGNGPRPDLLICSKEESDVVRKQTIKQDEASSKFENSSNPSSKINNDKGPGSFGGMKKGFLFGSSSKTKQSGVQKVKPVSKTSTQSSRRDQSKQLPVQTVDSNQGSKDIPFLQGKKDNEKDKLRLDEVQDKMKKSYPLLASKGIQWNPSIVDTLGTNISVLITGVSSFQG